MLTIVYNQTNGYVIPDGKIEGFAKNILDNHKNENPEKITVGSMTMINVFVAELMERGWDTKDFCFVYNDPDTGLDYNWKFLKGHGLRDIEILGDRYKDVGYDALFRMLVAETDDENKWSSIIKNIKE